jgi:hypothetical protein
MATNWSTVRLAVAGLAVLCLVAADRASAQTPRDYVVPLTARVSKKPLAITLEWDASPSTSSLTIYRRVYGQTAWSSPIAVSSSASSYKDASIAAGVLYEYRLVRQAVAGSSSITSYGFLCSGVEVPARESRGRIILLVDQTHTDALASELARLEQDLAGDGWTVLRHDVARTASVEEIKSIVRGDYEVDRENTRSLFLFGHVPVPYSGNIAPDGHPDHRGAWPADMFYAELTGTWTDTVLYDASTGRNRNEPGDGRLDQSTIPDDTELEVGRVDLAGMTDAGSSETELLRHYLDRDHAYRMGQMAYTSRGLIDDNFGIVSGEAFASNGWRNFSAMVGRDNVVELDWLSTLGSETYLFGYGCGPGSYTSASGVGTTTDLVSVSNGAIFSMLFGSYFGDWDTDNSFLRAPLASGDGLASAWVGRPSWYLHPMAMGETIGAGTRLTQNNSGEYLTRHARSVHIALMGDPTLRLNPVAPASSVIVSVASTGEALVTWTASPAPGATYNVYRADAPNGPYTRLNRSPLTGTSFQARRYSLARSATYMVRAVALTSSPSGSYYNASQGAFAEPAHTTYITPVDGAIMPNVDIAPRQSDLR